MGFSTLESFGLSPGKLWHGYRHLCGPAAGLDGGLRNIGRATAELLGTRESASLTVDLSRDACSGGAAGATCLSKHFKAVQAADSDEALAVRAGRAA